MRNDYQILSNPSKSKKRIYTSSIEKIFHDNQSNKILSDEQIDENIKQCYHNLKNLRNAFRIKKNSPDSINNTSKTIETTKYDNSKANIYYKEYSKDSNRTGENNSLKNIKVNLNNNLNNNYNNNNNNNSINNIKKFKDSNPFKIPFKNPPQLTLSQFSQYNNKPSNTYSDKNILMGRSLSHKNNNSVSVTIGDTIYNNQLLFSNRLKNNDNEPNSIKDNYIFFYKNNSMKVEKKIKN